MTKVSSSWHLVCLWDYGFLYYL